MFSGGKAMQHCRKMGYLNPNLSNHPLSKNLSSPVLVPVPVLNTQKQHVEVTPVSLILPLKRFVLTGRIFFCKTNIFFAVRDTFLKIF